jgi:predicted DNA-binding transcriptional regulator AlpA
MQLGQCRVAWYCNAVEAWIASRGQPAVGSDAS